MQTSPSHVAMRLEAPEAIDFETAANSEATLRLQKSSQHLQLQAHAALKTIRLSLHCASESA